MSVNQYNMIFSSRKMENFHQHPYSYNLLIIKKLYDLCAKGRALTGLWIVGLTDLVEWRRIVDKGGYTLVTDSQNAQPARRRWIEKTVLLIKYSKL